MGAAPSSDRAVLDRRSNSPKKTALRFVTILHLFLLLLHTLALEIFDHVWWAVLDEIALLIETSPLGQTIWNVHDTL